MALDRLAAQRQADAAKNCADEIRAMQIPDLQELMRMLRCGWSGEASSQFIQNISGLIEKMEQSAAAMEAYSAAVTARTAEVIEQERQQELLRQEELRREQQKTGTKRSRVPENARQSVV